MCTTGSVIGCFIALITDGFHFIPVNEEIHASGTINSNQVVPSFLESSSDWVCNCTSTATTNGNYIIITGLKASAFTLSGTNVGGRSVLNGLQIVAAMPRPVVTSLDWVPGGLELSLSNLAAGATYRSLTTTNLPANDWGEDTSFTPSATTYRLTNTVDSTQQQFWQIVWP